MAYGIDELKENEEFISFVKNTFGRDVDSMNDRELDGLQDAFAYHHGNVNDKYLEIVIKKSQTLPKEVISTATSLYFEDKQFSDLTTEQQVAVIKIIENARTDIVVENFTNNKNDEISNEEVIQRLYSYARKNEKSGNEEFRNFVKDTFDRDEETLRDDEKDAMLRAFEYHKNTISDRNLNTIDRLRSVYDKETLDTVTDSYFPDKKFDDLSDVQQLGVVATTAGIRNTITQQKINEGKYDVTQEVSLDEIKAYLQAVQNEEPLIIDSIEKEDGDKILDIDNEKGDEEIDRVVPDQEKDKGGHIKTKQNETIEEVRRRSFISDDNDFLHDTQQLVVLREMGIVSKEEIQALLPDNIKDAADLVSMAPKMSRETADLLNKKVEKLSSKQRQEFNDKLITAMLENQSLLTKDYYGNEVTAFQVVTPSHLADAYEYLNNRIKSEKDEEKRNAFISQKEQIGQRMDELTDMIVKEAKTSDDFHFADKTNIADVYYGYEKMFKVRTADLKAQDEEKNKQSVQNAKQNKQEVPQPSADPRIANMENAQNVLSSELNKYKEIMNISGLTKDDTGRLESRFDKINKLMKDVQLTSETMALMSNVKFLDDKGQTKPQFVNEKDSNDVSDTYRSGDVIIPGSELEAVVRYAKQGILQENLGADTEITAEYLTQEVNGYAPEIMHVLTQQTEINKMSEHPREFTDKTKLEQFTRDLADPTKKKEVSEEAFIKGINVLADQNAGYADVVGHDIGRTHSVVHKIHEPIKDLDYNAHRRMAGLPSKGAVRREMASRLVKGAISTVAVSAGITVLGTMASADAGLTASTGGLNKLAGMAIGTGLAVGMTVWQIKKWRKAQKQAGKPAGFKAFFKDRKMMMTVATTAMGATALGFAATGNPGVAQALGLGALAIGTANGVISNYKDSREQGLGKFESIGWSAGQAVINVAGAAFGRWGAGQIIEAYNHANPDNNLFRHDETTSQTHIERHYVYDQEMDAAAKGTLEKFYNGNTEAMNADLAKVQAQFDELGYKGSAARYLMQAIDAGHNTGIDTVHHVQGGSDIHSHGNHTVMTDSWAEGRMNVEDLHGFRDSIENGITRDNLKTFELIDRHVNENNQIGWVKGADMQNDGVLGYNANEQDGKFVTAEGDKADRYTTYAGDERDKWHYHEETNTTYTTNKVDNEIVGGVGMFGVLGNFAKKAKDRAGSILDKIVGKKGKVLPPEPPVPPVPPEPVIPPVPPVPPVPIIEEDKSKKMLMEEYYIVYGVIPKEDAPSFVKYCERVEKERVAGNQDKPMEDFLVERKSALKESIMNNYDGDKKSFERIFDNPKLVGKANAVAETRNSLMGSNLPGEAYTDMITMSAFTKYSKHVMRADNINADYARDPTKGPVVLKDIKKASVVTITNLYNYLVKGKKLEDCQDTITVRSKSELRERLHAEVDLTNRIMTADKKANQPVKNSQHKTLDTDRAK